MTVSFPLDNGRNVSELINHLAKYNLTSPGSCALTVSSYYAVVVSPLSFQLSSAKTAW